jgi:HlyD family secretion protein
MSKSKWIIFSIVGLVILLVILKVTGVFGKGDEVKVITEKVSKRTIVETVNATGKIYPETEVKITPDMSGEVTSLNVQEGDSVKKGQVLAHISSGNITSPMDGTVILMNVKKGERVVGSSMMAGTEIMRIADLSKLEVKVDVAENDIAKVHVGDSAIIDVDAYNNRKFKGIVTQIAGSNNGSSSQGTMPGNDVTSYKVHISLLQSSYQDLLDSNKNISPFRPGMSASADIQTTTHINKLAVPINAVTVRDKNDTSGTSSDYSNGKSNDDVNATGKNNSADDLEEVVFVLQQDKRLKKVSVKTDIQDINYIEIVTGLKEGDEVITGPYDAISKTLKEGMKVKVVPKNELFDKKK